MNTSSKQTCQENYTHNPHSFDLDIAVKYGPEEAILINGLQDAILNHKMNETDFHEGRYWVKISVHLLTTIYPYWTTRVINRIIKSLKDQNVIITGNFNKSKYDHTNWFAFNDEDEFINKLDN